MDDIVPPKEAPTGFDALHHLYQHPNMLKGETPSANHISNARSIGKLAAYMANKGTLNGKQLLSEKAWNKFHADPKIAIMDRQTFNTFTKGGGCVFGLEE